MYANEGSRLLVCKWQGYKEKIPKLLISIKALFQLGGSSAITSTFIVMIVILLTKVNLMPKVVIINKGDNYTNTSPELIIQPQIPYKTLGTK